MEDGVNAMTDAEILAGAIRQKVELDGHTKLSVQFRWPDGFGCTSAIDAYCDEAKAERFAVRVRREYLRRKGLAHAG